MGLEADHAVHHVSAGFLQPVRQFYVGLLVEARAQFDDDRHVLAGVRRLDQGIDDRGVAAGAVQRLLDGEHGWVGGGLPQEIHHRCEALEGMVQQQVGLADRREHVGCVVETTGQARCERRVLQVVPGGKFMKRR